MFVLERTEHAKQRNAPLLTEVLVWHGLPAGELTGWKPVPQGMTDDGFGGVVSSAGCCFPGGVFIEHWTGRCQAAAGAASVAAVIGAVMGEEVPLTQSSSLDSVSVGRLDLDTLRSEDGKVCAIIIADADGAHLTHLGLAIPPSPVAPVSNQ